MNFPTTRLYDYTAGTTASGAKVQAEFANLYTIVNSLATRDMAQIRATSVLSVTTSAANTILPFSAEDFDTANMHDNATNNSRLTVVTSGYYEAAFHIVFPAATTGTFRSAGIQVDTTLVYTYRVSATTNIQTLDGSIIYPCAAGQYFTLGAQHDHTSALALTTESYFRARQIG